MKKLITKFLKSIITLFLFISIYRFVPTFASDTGYIGDVATEVTKGEAEELAFNTDDFVLEGFTNNGEAEDMQLNKTYSITYKNALDYYGTILNVKVDATLIEDNMDYEVDNTYTKVSINTNNKLSVNWRLANNSKVKWTITTIDPETGNPYPTKLITGLQDPDESNYLFDTASVDLYYVAADIPENADPDIYATFDKGFEVKANGVYPINKDGENGPINYVDALLLVSLNGASSFSFVTDTFNAGGMNVPYWYKITKEFKISYDLDGGTNDPDNPTSYVPGEEKTINDPTKTGYKFVEWEEGNKINKDDVGDKTFTAKWDPIYTVTYDANGGNGKMDDQEFMGSDDTMNSKENEFTKEGHKFTGFKAYITDPETGEEGELKDDNGNPLIFDSVQDLKKYLDNKPGGTSIRLEAQWDKLITVTYKDPDTSETYQVTTIGENDPEPEAPKDPNKDGKKFEGWKKTTDKDGNITYEAIWSHTVTYVDLVTNTIYQFNEVIDGNNEPEAPTNPIRKGYKFRGWDRQVDQFGNVIYVAVWREDLPYVAPKTGI